MKKTIWFCEFQDAFTNCGRGDSFSYKGLEALYNYLTQLEDDCGIELELDPIAFDCEYTEFDSIKDCYKEYEYTAGTPYAELGEDEDERDKWASEFLNEHTQVISFDGGIVIANF